MFLVCLSWNTVHPSRVDSSTLVFSLSSHRHSSFITPTLIYVLSLPLTLSINNKQLTGDLEIKHYVWSWIIPWPILGLGVHIYTLWANFRNTRRSEGVPESWPRWVIKGRGQNQNPKLQKLILESPGPRCLYTLSRGHYWTLVWWIYSSVVFAHSPWSIGVAFSELHVWWILRIDFNQSLGLIFVGLILAKV